MSFGAPLGLLGLLAALPVIAAYFLRRRQPPRVVSALFLWRSVRPTAEAGAKLERFSRELSLALELLAILLASLALADLHFSDPAGKPHLVVIVDGGLSMQARQVAERARTLIAARLSAHPDAQVTLIESGVRPQVLAGPRADQRMALAALAEWAPAQPAHDLTLAFATAAELAQDSRQRLLFVTDGPLSERLAPPDTLEVVSVGSKLPNVAFLSAHRRHEDAVSELTLRLASYSESAADVPVRVELPDGGVQTALVKLAAGGTGLVRLKVPSDVEVCASLPDDALPLDGQLTVLSSVEAPVHVGALAGLQPEALSAVKRALAVLPGIEWSPSPTFTIGPRESGASLSVGAPGTQRHFVGPFFAQKEHPVLDDVQLGGVLWAAGANPPGVPLLTAGDAVLLAEEDDGRLHLNLDLTHSNLQRTAAWPVLLSNILRRVRAGAPGLTKRQLMLGEQVSVVVPPGASWHLEGPQGIKRRIFGVGAMSLPALPRPGRWALYDRDQRLQELEVMALDPSESDLRTRGPFARAALHGELFTEPLVEQPRLWWLLALLALVLLVDFWLTARGHQGKPVEVGGAT